MLASRSSNTLCDLQKATPHYIPKDITHHKGNCIYLFIYIQTIQELILINGLYETEVMKLNSTKQSDVLGM
jgi:hypothetical protein